MPVDLQGDVSQAFSVFSVLANIQKPVPARHTRLYLRLSFLFIHAHVCLLHTIPCTIMKNGFQNKEHNRKAFVITPTQPKQKCINSRKKSCLQ